MSSYSKNRHTNIPAAYVVFMHNDDVLLLRRYNTGYQDGKYSLVAGHVEAEESFSAAAVREALEEAGVGVAPEDLEFAHMTHRRAEDSERVDVFFVVRKWHGELTNREPEKCDDLSWFNIRSLPDNLIPYVRQALEAIRDKKAYSEWGWKK